MRVLKGGLLEGRVNDVIEGVGEYSIDMRAYMCHEDSARLVVSLLLPME